MLPLSYLKFQKTGQVLTLSNNQAFDDVLFKGVDLVIFSRECPFDLDRILSLREEFKFKLIVDVDDYWILYRKHFYYDAWKKHGIKERIIKAMKVADVVTTTNEKLKQKILHHNPNVTLFPNAFPYGFDQFIKQPKLNQKNILYAGGITHFEDLHSISHALNRCRQNPIIQREFKFVLAGYNGKTKETKNEWDRIVSVANEFGSCEIMDYLPPTHFMNHYKNGALCVAPLQKNTFNQFKSDLKIVEAGCNAIPIIVSDLHPYNVIENPGVTICKSQNDWYQAFLRYSKAPEKLIEDGEALYEYVNKNYNLMDINKGRMALFQNITGNNTN